MKSIAQRIVNSKRRVRTVTACLCALAAAGCCTSEVQIFTATPAGSATSTSGTSTSKGASVCPGGAVALHWQVKGRTELSATPPPAFWEDGAAFSSGTRYVTVATPTTFTVTAPDANPAKGNATRNQFVTLLNTPVGQDRAAPSTCSTDGTVQGTVTPTDAGNAQVAHISAPTAKYGVKEQAVRICVTHLDRTACVDPGQTIDFPTTASGAWTLRLDPTPSPACQSVPGQLRISLDFACGT
jgi:hypothetical protein